jgi:hypothetical protein
MLIISQRQLDLITDARMSDVKLLLDVRARRVFPIDVALMGEESLDGVLELTLRRARKYHLETTFDVFAYFDLMFALGSHFDVDPFLPWAADALKLPTGSERMQALRRDALSWIESATGEDGRPTIRAMLRARALTADDVAHARAAPPVPFDAPLPDPALPHKTADAAMSAAERRHRCRAFLADLHPEKFRVIGLDSIERGMSEALYRADLADLSSPLGRNLYVLLAFMLGSGFARDPQFAWAAEAVREGDGADRDVRLFDAARGALIAGIEQLRTLWMG